METYISLWGGSTGGLNWRREVGRTPMTEFNIHSFLNSLSMLVNSEIKKRKIVLGMWERGSGTVGFWTSLKQSASAYVNLTFFKWRMSDPSSILIGGKLPASSHAINWRMILANQLPPFGNITTCIYSTSSGTLSSALTLRSRQIHKSIYACLSWLL